MSEKLAFYVLSSTLRFSNRIHIGKYNLSFDLHVMNINPCPEYEDTKEILWVKFSTKFGIYKLSELSFFIWLSALSYSSSTSSATSTREPSDMSKIFCPRVHPESSIDNRILLVRQLLHSFPSMVWVTAEWKLWLQFIKGSDLDFVRFLYFNLYR